MSYTLDDKIETVMKTMTSQLATTLRAEGDKLALEGLSELKHIHEYAEKIKVVLDSVETALKTVNTSQNSTIRSIYGIVKQLDETIKNNTNEIKNNTNEIKRAAEKQLHETRKAAKIASLQWAMAHSEIGQFEYEIEWDRYDSSEMVREILMVFMTDCGYFLDDDHQVNGSRSEFESSLKDQIHKLTGVEPRITKKSRKQRRCIFFGTIKKLKFDLLCNIKYYIAQSL